MRREPPGALAARVAILAANGYEKGARNDALLLAAKPLCPRNALSSLRFCNKTTSHFT